MLDWILKDSVYKHAVDEAKIGVIGHSAGGYTALALIGGMPNMAGTAVHCGEQSDDIEFCEEVSSIYMGLFRIFTSGRNVDDDPLGGFCDLRIKAAVLMAPVGALFRDTKSLSMVTVPVLIFRAGKDDVPRYPYHADSIRRKLPMQPRYIVVENAGHYSFLSPFLEGRKRMLEFRRTIQGALIAWNFIKR